MYILKAIIAWANTHRVTLEHKRVAIWRQHLDLIGTPLIVENVVAYRVMRPVQMYRHSLQKDAVSTQSVDLFGSANAAARLEEVWDR